MRKWTFQLLSSQEKTNIYMPQMSTSQDARMRGEYVKHTAFWVFI